MHSPGRQAPLASPRLLYGKQVIIDRLTAVRQQLLGAGADHVIGVDAMRFEHLDHADVGETARCAAAKGETDLRFLGLRCGGRSRLAAETCAAGQGDQAGGENKAGGKLAAG